MPTTVTTSTVVPDSPNFTVLESAAYLKIPETTFLLLLRRGTFSYKKVGKRYLVPKAEVETFARTGFHKQGVR